MAAFAFATIAASPAPATTVPGTPTALATASASTGTATEPVATVTPIPSATEELPPRPGSPTPTPALPEEGGPPGGVLGGHLYIDNDASGSLTPGDGTPGGTVIVDALDSDGRTVHGYGAATDTSGVWQIRALPDGAYRVRWDPPVPESQWPLTIPPVQAIVLNPIETVHAVTRTVEISGASRILDIDFGIPKQQPVAGGGLPSTGTGGSADGSWLPMAFGAFGIALAFCGAAWLTLRRRIGTRTS